MAQFVMDSPGTAVQFGAGKIGRGLVGRILINAGYDVLFVDVNEDLVSALNEKKAYIVRTLGDSPGEYRVTGVRAIHVSHRPEIVRAIAAAGLVTTSVGAGVLKDVASVIREGIELRVVKGGGSPLNIIACENLEGASSILRSCILEDCSPEAAEFITRFTGFPEAQIGTIAPNIVKPRDEDPLTVYIEGHGEFYVGKGGFVGGVPEVPGIRFVEDVGAYIDRKVFTTNTGHAVGGYAGYLKGYEFMHEAVGDPEIREMVTGALDETSRVLVAAHHFDPYEQEEYARWNIRRFEDPTIGDPVLRLARDPIRKLGPNDRLVRPARMALEFGIIPDHLALGIAAALLYDSPSDSQAQVLAGEMTRFGVDHVLEKICGISTDSELTKLIKASLRRMRDMRDARDMRLNTWKAPRACGPCREEG